MHGFFNGVQLFYEFWTDCFIPLSVSGGENTHKLCSAGENQWFVYNYVQCSEVLHKADVQENVDDNMLSPLPIHV